jgi:hypothetical protein
MRPKFKEPLLFYDRYTQALNLFIGSTENLLITYDHFRSFLL